ncbi:MAG: hypothetical protein AB8I69_07315, partial [Anaerolineae bacterium]
MDSQAKRSISKILWSAELDQPPAGPPLTVGDLLLIPTQELGPPAYHATLHALSTADGSLRWRYPFKYALISGLQAFETSALISTTSTDLMRGEGALIALDAAGQER